MKKTLYLVIILCLVALQQGCGENMVVDRNPETEIDYSICESDIADADVCERCLDFQTELDRMNQVLKEIHMQPDGAGEYDKYLEKKWMAGENVKVRKVPYNTELENMTSNWLSYTRVDIECIVLGEYNEEEDQDKVFKQYNNPWALISFYSPDTALDTVGWVQLNELIEYTEETKHLLHGSVSLAEGAIDVNTGKPVEFKNLLSITRYEGDYVLLFSAGGIVYKVHKDYVMYPEP